MINENKICFWLRYIYRSVNCIAYAYVCIHVYVLHGAMRLYQKEFNHVCVVCIIRTCGKGCVVFDVED